MQDQFTVDTMPVRIGADGAAVAAAAAAHTAAVLRDRVAANGAARVVVATGNSQLPFVRALRGEDVPWSRVTVFHMDEYVGVGDDHPASFRRWIRREVTEPYGPAVVHYIDGTAGDPAAECDRYEELLRAAPVDLVCLGIGENGHLAFNEPDVADPDDTRWARIVELTDVSRRQQVGEGHFPDLAAVPATAISLTVPALLGAAVVQAVVPEARKAAAVRAALTGPVGRHCPASLLRTHPGAVLFLDRDSAGQLDGTTADV
ncbi:6-phosphogluconolactonase [Actinocatenispora rupis]|uniref:Glucosamine-6-phosphate deaminase n=1 Tax=Actinocatenispora rupis TaxID=519421 RepID=A0A8J3J5Z5_9ACTN|nr:6-phosphogluconolactonase [Actinocatenispora rupis]GID10797.1 glucosamine-6-phosphate deaminase [Actinocatenispora rupis]